MVRCLPIPWTVVDDPNLNGMKRITLPLTFLLTCFFTAVFAQTYPPSCVVTMPYNGAYFKAGTDVEIQVYSTDIGKSTNNGTVSKVEFLNGDTKLGEASTHTNNTFRYVWKCVTAGTYTIKARATNSRGTTFTSVGVIITVGTNNVTQRGLSACKGKYMAGLHQNQFLVNFTQLFNGASTENACKWGSVEGTRDVFNWGGADKGYNDAMNNNMMFRYHAILWASQYPSWLFGLSTADARAEVVEYIKAVAARFPKADQVDVLNEQLFTHQKDNQKLRDLMSGKANTAVDDFSWQIWLFEQARANFPNTKLVLNDYGLEGSTSNINEMLKLVKALRDRGLIDGFGTQAHHFSVDNTTASRLKQDLDLMATGGVPVYVTELDMCGGIQNYSTNEQAQATSFQTHVPVFWEHYAVKGITWWGHQVNNTWVTGTGFVNSNGTDRAAGTWLKNYMSGRSNVGYPICATNACIPTDLGSQDLQQDKGVVYPNPFTDHIDVKVGGSFHYQVLNMEGRVVEEGYSEGRIELGDDLSKGLYMLKITQEDKTKLVKLVKE